MHYRKLVRNGSWWDIWTVRRWRFHWWRWQTLTIPYSEVAVGPIRILRAKGAGAHA